ncbi:MAG: hypothetical protein E7Z63_00880 [Thermoplasmata archaeon]|nr:hypothetical protein [Thermoplasmata archaeon]
MLTKEGKPGKVKVRKGMKTYTIPVDQTGCVPMWAVVERFQEVGNKHSDRGIDSDVVLPRNLTPEEIIDWWADPSCCDIDGIDDEVAEIYSVPLSIRGKKRDALRNLAVVATKKESNRIKKILADSFTAEELELLTRDKGFYITTNAYMDDCTGYYLRMQDGVRVPHIVLEDGTTPDGIVHEVVHHLRALDGRTTFPTNREGVLMNATFNAYPKSKRDALVEREERETVAETVARTRVDRVQSGYYDSIPGMDSREAYLRDQDLISQGRALKGKAAIRAAQRNFDKSCISRAVISSNKKAKR